MRLTVLALALLPIAAQAQSTTTPTPTEPLAQAQSCPVGMAWNAGAGACTEATDAASPLKGLGGPSGCSHGAAREVMS
ncbi:hypothetical protein N9E38_01155 [Yoonia sp.]|uniref:hypothetical protein n=1 Tax=Yoonia sp. TaxID=2212373 RepID=UPI002322AB4A|nr:hypothetical protein [Yoonia sp.]MDA9980028.1 hypothetical protein [Yoonia sp.]MDB4112210.1 hypothetical protein [Yoonia sp.]MDB4254955.1 hypothetical protein [bacterium]